MLLDKDGKKLRGWDVQGLTSAEKDLILVFLQGAVYCWCNTRKCESFCLRSLVGGDNRDWHGTILQNVYEFYGGDDDDDAYDKASSDLGKLLKDVLVHDDRTFILEEVGEYPLTYHWNGIIVEYK